LCTVSAIKEGEELSTAERTFEHRKATESEIKEWEVIQKM
jgi:hypothetical protein